MLKSRHILAPILAGLCALTFSSPASAQTVTRGPYLQSGAPNSIVVRWRTNVAVDSRVSYGVSQGSLTNTVDDFTTTTEHEVLLTGLSADTQYFYAIGSTSQILAGDDADHFFLTSPVPGTEKPLQVWVLGDSGHANNSARAVRDAYLGFTGSTYTDVWLMLGDNAYSSGTDSEYQAAVFDQHASVLRQTPLWPTLGNHDGASADSATQTGVYYDIFTLPKSAQAGGLASGTEAYYSFDYANIHFVCLDSHDSDRSPTGPMLTWLANDLGATTQKWIIAFWHHPPSSKGSHNSDTEGKLIDLRENALPILESFGVDLVMGGHSHAYERSLQLHGHYGTSGTLTNQMIVDGGDGRTDGDGAYIKDSTGAVYIVAGSSAQTGGGSLNHPVMFLSLAQLGSLVLNIDGDRMDVRFLDDVGIFQDYLTILKTPAGNQAPSVDAGGDQTIILPATASLDGIVSDDGLPDPPALTTTWSMVTGPAVVTFPDPGSVNTTASFPVQGTYVLQLTADDGELTFSDEVTITVLPVGTTNQPPVVDAGPPQTVTLPGSVTLNGTVTDDGLPNPPGAVTILWSTVSGPGAVAFANANVLDTTASFSTDGTYVLRLTADDSALSASKDVTVTVDPIPPMLDIRVAASTDDAEEASSGSVNLTSSDLELIREASDQTVGMRFNGVTIPQGATITQATIQFAVDEVTSEATSLTIQAEASDNAVTFSTSTNNISSRPRTTASVSWSPPAWNTVGAAGPDQQTPNFAASIQEVIDLPGWASGNSLVVIITGTGKRVAESFNGSVPSAALLHLEYNTGPPINTAPVAVNDDLTGTPVTVGGTLVNLDVLANDTDADGMIDVTSVTITGQTNGVATVNGDGTVDFSHDGTVSTVASFTYTVDDNDGATSNVATVSLAVTSANNIVLDANFDSASIGPYTINGNVIDLTLQTDQISNNTDDYTYLVNFKLSNVLGQEITLNFTGIDAVPFLAHQPEEKQMVYSCDGETWNRLTQHAYSAANLGTYTVTQIFSCNEVQIATFFPFSYQRMQDFIDAVSLSPWATQTFLGSSLQQRDIDLLTITNTAVPDSAKKHIYIVGRHHAAETSSSHMLEGLINFMISSNPDAAAMRDNFVWHIVPMLNVDGVSEGNSRATSELRDPNRDWGNNETDVINIVRSHLGSINSSFGVDMFIDWHSQMNDLRWSNFVYSPPGNTFFPILSQWTDFDEQEAVGSSCSASSCTSRGYATIQLGLFTFVFEPTPHLVTWTKDSLKQQGVNTSYAIAEYFGVALSDTDPPTPDPMTWLVVPNSTGTTSISMTAATASDPSGVEYFFTNTTIAGHNSVWQDSPTFEDTGLQPDTSYTYTVIAHDKSSNQNETAPSTAESATTDAQGMDVTLLDGWVVDGTYATQDATFDVSSGTNRIVLVALSAEKNQNGPISVTSVSLGNQVLTQVHEFTVGNTGAYHNLHWVGYLLESEIAARSGSALTINYSNAPSNPFDQPKIHYASYQNVDQTNPIADFGSNLSTSASSLQLSSAITAGDGDKIVAFNVAGQHYAPGMSTPGYAEVTEFIGATNGHASAAYDRTATTAVTENPTFTVATGTRMAVSAVVLNAAGGVDTTPPVITLVGATPQIVERGTAYTELGAIATDVTPGDLTGDLVIDASAVDTTTVGSYVVTYNVTDGAGNPAVEVTRTVTVQDTTSPVITLVGANPQQLEVGTAYPELGATATDLVPGDLTGALVIDTSAVDTTTVGSYVVMYNVTDGAGNPAVEVTRTVTVQDTTPPVVVANSGSTVAEGGTDTITNTELRYDDTEQGPAAVAYTVTGAPPNGQLELTSASGVAVTSFTQSNIDSGLLVYVHDGSNTTSDAFTFAVDDGQGNNVVGLSFSLTITAVDDDPPVQVANSGSTVAEGGTDPITNTELRYDDQQPVTSITYAVTTAPVNGQLELTSVSGVAITSFTQADIDTGLVVYVHNGSNTTLDTFTFNVDDGQGNNVIGVSFGLTITAVDNEPPVQVANTGSALAEGGTDPILSTELRYDDQQPVTSITYTVTTTPANGQLELTSAPGVGISTFTQFNIDAGLVVYVHNGSNTISDGFTFNVDDGQGNSLDSQSFGLTITPVDNEPPVQVANTGSTVAEGGTDPISSTELRYDDTEQGPAAVAYTVTGAPTNGQLELTSASGVAVTSFTQSNIDSGLVVYVHNGSNTTLDTFTFNVDDGQGNSLDNQSFAITVTVAGPMPVTLLDGWVVDGSYANQDAVFNVSPGTNRMVVVALSAEKNGSGPISVTSVSLGDQQLTELFDFTVGSSTAYHNLHWVGYLLEAEIATRIGSSLTITYANAPSNPFDQPKIHYASYQNVDQINPIADFGSNSSTSASSLQLSGTVTADEGDKIIGFNVAGQHYAPGMSTSGYAEVTEFVGATNGHASAAYDRTETGVVTENPTFTVATGTRMAVSALVLNSAAPTVDNDPPALVFNTGSSVAEGGTDPITSTELRYVDQQPATNVTYTVTAPLPLNGHLELNSGPGTAITTFTQFDIDEGLVVYVHDGSNTTQVEFTFDVSDGQGNSLFGESFAITVTVGAPVAVTLLDPWVVDGSYATQDATFTVSPGTDRIVVVALSAEKNGSGPMAVTSVSLGGQVLTEVFDFTVGNSGAYHNLHWVGYLLESQIPAGPGLITISYANAPTDPFDQPKIHYASYQNVDQTNPIADSGFNSSTSASSLQLPAITAGDGDKIVGFNVLGQHYAPGLSTSGYTEETESIGATNGHASGAYHRTATTGVTEHPTFTSATATRMAVSAVVLNAAVAVSP